MSHINRADASHFCVLFEQSAESRTRVRVDLVYCRGGIHRDDADSVLTVAQDAAISVSSANNCVGRLGCGLLVPFPTRTRQRVDELGFLWMVGGTCFDPVLPYVV